ncbi:MAG: 1,6-anhydro-N-acetylmuramyl-L-alanine amidase AmpD [Pseudomonadota bacterium]|jgi:AmpD protein
MAAPQAGGAGWLPRIRHLPSPNFNARPAGCPVDTVIIHYISLPPGRFSGDAIDRLFTNRLAGDPHPVLAELSTLKVSAHFLIRRPGTLVQYVSTDDRAWHAGPSRLLNRSACNDFSIGIELEGDGHHPFTHAQYRRLSRLLELLRQRHPLRLIAGHEDIAPDRKFDPGPFFDWPRVLSSPGGAGLIRPFSPNSPVRPPTPAGEPQGMGPKR